MAKGFGVSLEYLTPTFVGRNVYEHIYKYR
jgi:hypothetical protein